MEIFDNSFITSFSPGLVESFGVNLYPIEQYVKERESDQDQGRGSSQVPASNRCLTLNELFHVWGNNFLTIK